ncbi:hypothetical protein P691DRAFT_736039 [Macrolepiota fuliginosa MF-IS2]|uniref:T6SS Phospholipase effector Tle1-like catalytic domain-containing protein n=1 Tax=Macrolepiota fuliginosa MF-IS2 TaxID=1400762 RepID=A0A9P5X538_9AGAR|nr:hypothetical protein P691DRAFT_736039 [Macrolepiota fuliginosa MF-IS2]
MASELSPPTTHADSQSENLYIPERAPTDEHRTLILLFDGTGDKEDADVTNIVLLRDMLYGWGDDTANNDKQLVYYQQGIGTYFPRFKDTNFYIPFLSPVSRTVDEAIAWSLPYHVIDGYRWLVENYKPGDKVSIFGFSRGAYTARALAGMLNAVDLLPPSHLDKADDAYKLFDRAIPKERYRDDPITKEAWTKLVADFATFKNENHCTTVFIDFLGCWDTVNSVGMIRPIKLKFTANNDIVRVFRHALALDEHRVRFKPNLWGKPKPQANSKPRVVTDVEEVWFAGCHCDVGGGSVRNDVRPSLAHIPLRWMIRQIFKTETGILFKADDIKIIGIEPSHLYPKVLPRPNPLPPPDDATLSPPNVPGFIKGWTNYFISFLPFTGPTPKPLTIPHPDVTEEEHDLLDCLSPVYDQLELKPTTWRPMEECPLITEVFQPNAVYPELSYKEERTRHLGAGRTIPPASSTHGNKIKIHRTVKIRMQAATVASAGKGKGEHYCPKARVTYDKVDFAKADATQFEWVD